MGRPAERRVRNGGRPSRAAGSGNRVFRTGRGDDARRCPRAARRHRCPGAAARAAGDACGARFAGDAPGTRPGLPTTGARWQQRRAEQQLAARMRDVLLAPPQRQTIGTFVGLCLLVQFPDVPGTITREEVDAFCNDPGYTGFGNNGSVCDYYRDVSGGRVNYTNLVAPYYTAKHPRSYYTDETVRQPIRAIELITEALDDLIVGGFDVSVAVDRQSRLRVCAERVLRRPSGQQLGQGPVAARAPPHVAVSPACGHGCARLPDHRHGQRAEPGHVLSRERPHALRLSGSVRLRRRIIRRRRVLPDVCGRQHQPEESGARRRVSEVPRGMGGSDDGAVGGQDDHAAIGSESVCPPAKIEYGVLRDREPPEDARATAPCRRRGWRSGTSTNWATTATSRCRRRNTTSARWCRPTADRISNRRSTSATAAICSPPARHGTFGHASQPASRWWDGTNTPLQIVDISASGASMKLSVP